MTPGLPRAGRPLQQRRHPSGAHSLGRNSGSHESQTSGNAGACAQRLKGQLTCSDWRDLGGFMEEVTFDVGIKGQGRADGAGGAAAVLACSGRQQPSAPGLCPVDVFPEMGQPPGSGRPSPDSRGRREALCGLLTFVPATPCLAQRQTQCVLASRGDTVRVRSPCRQQSQGVRECRKGRANTWASPREAEGEAAEAWVGSRKARLGGGRASDGARGGGPAWAGLCCLRCLGTELPEHAVSGQCSMRGSDTGL